MPALPPPDLVSLPLQPDWPRRLRRRHGLGGGRARCCCGWISPSGWPPNWPGRRGAAPTALPAGLASRFSLKADLLPVVLRRLGFRIVPAGGLAPDECRAAGAGDAAAAAAPAAGRGEPAPQAQAHGPFAALAALKR